MQGGGPGASAVACLRAAAEASGPGAVRVRLLIELSDAIWRSGDLPSAVASAARAYDEARGLDDPELQALAALALAAAPETGLSDEPLLGALQATVDDPRVGPGPAARVRARLAAALHAAGRPEAAQRHLAPALEAADALPASDRCFVLRCRQWLLSAPEDQHRRRAAAEELVATATALGDAEQLAWAHGWRLSALLTEGDLSGAAADAARCARLADRLDEPFHRSSALMWESPLAVLRGDLSGAEELARRAWSRDIRLGFEEHLLALQLWEPLRLQGRLGELRPQLEPLLEVDEPVWRVTVPLARLQSGDRQAALTLLREQVSSVGALPRDLYWLFGLGALAATCVALEQAAEARPLYDLLLPFSARVCDAAGIAVCGPAGLHLAGLARLLGEPAVARRHLADVEAWISACGAHGYLAPLRQAQGALDAADGWGSLTPAERRVADLVAEGLTNPEVAQRLHLSRYTVETHLKRVFAKLGLHSRAGLAAEVVRRRTT